MEYEDQEEEQELAYSTELSVLPSPVRYKECLKNQAVGIGAHAIDGCGEFLSADDSLKCAACGCHRNFHRRVGFGNLQQPLLLAHPMGCRSSGYLQMRPPPKRAALALPSTSGGGHGDEMLEDYYSRPGSSGAKKRFRTKFTAEQKERMLSLAERLDWKIQKQDEELVQQFCGEEGIKRHVLKVWMHNNKHTLEKPEAFCTAFIACVIGRISNSVQLFTSPLHLLGEVLSPSIYFHCIPLFTLRREANLATKLALLINTLVFYFSTIAHVISKLRYRY
ncbi:zinc-finger homeodomain protein 2-like isoform X1 [Salvia splendens]|uniref:zinc-finger homeodomain protein 2-like isoform X1 n=1 Tax=Salvia splendens TaxID=180675 RepID=UPI001C26006F|nr:zinc-finger homeodomain protein 2-like isoform X1 [Salvia splendens]